jgi:hypothetical protein
VLIPDKFLRDDDSAPIALLKKSRQAALKNICDQNRRRLVGGEMPPLF